MISPLVVQMPLNASRRQKYSTVGILCHLQRINTIERHRSLPQQLHSEVFIAIEASVNDRHGIVIELPRMAFEQQQWRARNDSFTWRSFHILASSRNAWLLAWPLDRFVRRAVQQPIDSTGITQKHRGQPLRLLTHVFEQRYLASSKRSTKIAQRNSSRRAFCPNERYVPDEILSAFNERRNADAQMLTEAPQRHTYVKLLIEIERIVILPHRFRLVLHR